ncbi:porin family protein [uncultured Massilia sp.]|uniref:porin family protein n=1 Tax=uncultured Massilia sp. TaxID=169973 RepID=UPI0025DBDDCD|nr:porin family protein [uncultured Massilia sp.]
MNKLIFALLAGIGAIGAAQAQTTPQAYIGIGAATADNQTKDEYRVGAKVYGGYQLDQNWAVEAGYTDFDSQDFNRGATRGSVKGSGSYIAGKYTVPFNERFSGYGKLGVAYSERKYNDNLGVRINDTDTGVYGALGVQYKLNQNLSLIGEYERYGKDKAYGAKADVYTVGLQYGF